MMDALHRVAAWATAQVKTHPELAEPVIEGISWADTLAPYALFIVHIGLGLTDLSEPTMEVLKATYELLDAIEPVLEAAEQSVEIFRELADVDYADVDYLDTSVEIGGAAVEAQMAEIKQLQAEHEAAIKHLTDQFSEQRREQLAAADEMEKKYFERHPDQAEAERQRDAQLLEDVKRDAMNDLSAKQETQMGELLQEQQRQLQEQQLTQQQKETQIPAESQQNRDGMTR